jgi:hypothetical protein
MMNIYIITDDAGMIVGTLSSTAEATVHGDQGQDVVKTAKLAPARQARRRVHSVELPSELEGLSAAELHEALATYDIEQGGEPARLVRRTTDAQ